MRALTLQRACVGSLLGDLACLAKLRLELLVLFATAAGFCIASAGHFEWARLMSVLWGTGLVAASAGVLNQVLEIEGDGRMSRTRNRPLPAGRVSRRLATALGIALAICGLAELALQTTFSAAAFAGIALALYIGVYTPLKKRTSLCVAIGAIAGALPPVIGWAAFDGSLAAQTGVLFGVLFAWQIPHVLAITWIHRQEYAAAGLSMLPRNDPSGRAAAIQAVAFSCLLFAITLAPVHTLSAGYLAGAVLLGAVLLSAAVRFLRQRSRATARTLFLVSLLYLPLLLTLTIFL
ncbi:MAG: heme o synthase [Verrucomicrobia bacterium]|nr:heme o synthase [Verrucomicrobiota bacterium]